MIIVNTLIIILLSLIVSFLYKNKTISLIFLLGGVCIAILMVAGIYITLPQGGADAAMFENTAWKYSQGTLSDVFATFKPSNAFNLSVITAIIYKFTGRDFVFAIMQNALLGLLIMHFSIRLFLEVWPQEKNKKLIIFFALVAFFPMLKLNSAILLRENYVILGVLLGALYAVKFVKSNNPIYFFLALIWILMATTFHSGAVVFILGIPLFYVFYSNTKFVNKLFLFSLSVFVIIFIAQYMQLGKFSILQDADDPMSVLLDKRQSFIDARTLYLTWLSPSNPIDIIWQAPIRMIFFILKPFPWDIRSIGDLIAWLDAAVWFLLLYSFYKSKSLIIENKAAVLLLICLLIELFVFSYGTSNYGTAIRHRTKFYIIALVIVAPYLTLPKFKR